MREQPDSTVGRPSALGDPGRLEALRLSALLDSPPEEAFDRCTRLVTRVLGVPVALVSLVDGQRQFFKSQVGLREPWASLRGTALSHSFCQHVVDLDAAFVVSDSKHDDRVAGNGAVEDLSVAAYAGAPVHGPGGEPLGSVCAIDHQPRQWSPDDVAVLQDLADVVSELIAMRAAAIAMRAAVLELSHDLRTGMTALSLEVDELVASAASEPAREQASRVLEGLRRQSAAVDGALRSAGLSRLGHERDVDLGPLLAAVVTRAAPAAARAGREVVVVADEPVEAGTSAPPSELGQLLDDVVALLLEHGQGRIALTVSAGSSGPRVRLVDESQGLPPSVVSALTERRDAVKDARAEPSLAERAARALGGRLVLASARPTTLDLLLPRARS